MSKTPDFEPLIEATSVLTSPNLESRSKIQPKASGSTGTKIDSQARTSIAPRPGMSVRATSQVRTNATGTEIAVRTMASAKLFHSAPSAVGSARADCQLPKPYRKACPAGATLKELVSSMPRGKTRMMPTTKGNPREAAHATSTASRTCPTRGAAAWPYSIAANAYLPKGGDSTLRGGGQLVGCGADEPAGFGHPAVELGGRQGAADEVALGRVA